MTEHVFLDDYEYIFSPNTNGPDHGAWFFCNECSVLVYDTNAHARWHRLLDGRACGESSPPGPARRGGSEDALRDLVAYERPDFVWLHRLNKEQSGLDELGAAHIIRKFEEYATALETLCRDALERPE